MLEKIGFQLAFFVLLLVLEYIFLGPRQSTLYQTRKDPVSAFSDVLYWLMNITPLGYLLAGFLTFNLASNLQKWLLIDPNHLNLLGIESPLVKVGAYLLLYDFVRYWKHRWSHQISWLWAIHRTHHLPTHMGILTANRLHPLELSFHRIFEILPLALLGSVDQLGPITFWYYTLRWTTGLLQHSNLPWDAGLFGRWLWASPAVHQVHHSIELHRQNSNFGNLLILWDRLFGTYHPPLKSVTYGVDPGSAPQTLREALLDPLTGTLDFYSALGSSLGSALRKTVTARNTK